MLSLNPGIYPRSLEAGDAMPLRMTWIRLSGTALCKLLFNASDGRLPNRAGPPTRWQTAHAPSYSRAPVGETETTRVPVAVSSLVASSFSADLLSAVLLNELRYTAMARMS